METHIEKITPVRLSRNIQPQSKLTDKAVSSAESRDKPWKLSDGHGLYLLVQPNGSKLWRWNYRFEGAAKTMPLGLYPATSLSLARKNRDDGREKLAQRIDPMAQRKAEKIASQRAAKHSFQAVAKVWWEHWSKTTSERHAGITWRRFEKNVFPVIGNKPMSKIQAQELVAMARGIEKRGASDIAKRALQSIGQVFEFAELDGIVSYNPARAVKPSKILALKPKENLARIDIRELPALLRQIDIYSGAPATRLAIKLMAMTFVRTTELIAAPWDEFDLDEALWRIPKERMKKNRPHIVPLSTQAVEILRTLHTLTGHGKLLFPGERDHAKPMSNNTILKALERMGFKGRMTGHGFRGLASTALHEQGFEHAFIELQLAHQEGNEVSAAYNHATYLTQRRDMMQQWSDYLDNVRTAKPRVVAERMAA